MKKAILSILFSIATLQFAFAHQVTGVIKLEGENNHAGVKVMYNATSGSATTDSTFTNADGEYSLNLQGGIYNLELSKDGFWSKGQNGILISKDEFFDHDSLRTTKGIKEISGSIKDTLYADTHYVAIGNIRIQAGDVLYIEPGVTISFKTDKKFQVNGELIAHGLPEQRITFGLYSGESEKWDGIYITRDSLNFEISYVNVIDAAEGFEVNSVAYFHLDNCFIHRVKYGMINFNLGQVVDSALIENCRFKQSSDVSLEGNVGYWVRVENNDFEHIFGRGLQARQNWDVIGNRFMYSRTGVFYQPGRVERNVFYKCSTGASGYSGSFMNNTFTDCDVAFSNGYYSAKKFTMNCFDNNEVDIDFGTGSGNSPEMKYNFFNYEAKFHGDVPLGMGVPVSTNNNGDEIDSYLNVIDTMAKLYTTDTANRHAFHPMKNSPLVDAGDPNYFDDDGSIRDIGAYPYSVLVGEEEHEITPLEIKVFPNPFSSVVNFEIPFQEEFDLTIFDGQGRMVKQGLGFNGPLFTMDLNDVEKGIYFYRIVTENKVYSGQLISR